MAVARFKDKDGNVQILENLRIKYPDLDERVLVSVDNAILSSSTDESVNGKKRALIKEGWINVVAEEKEGKFFNYFIDEIGQIVSYDKNFRIYEMLDKKYFAMYSNEEVERKPIVTLNGYTEDRKNLAFYFYASNYLPAGYTRKEWGFLLTSKLSGNDIVYGSALALVLNNPSNLNVSNSNYRAGFDEANFTMHMIGELRAYAKITKNGVDEIIYSSNTIRIPF